MVYCYCCVNLVWQVNMVYIYEVPVLRSSELQLSIVTSQQHRSCVFLPLCLFTFFSVYVDKENLDTFIVISGDLKMWKIID